MYTDGCLLRSAGGRRQVTSISALFRVCLQVPESIALPRKQVWNSRDPTWIDDILPSIQVIAPSSSSIGISISVPFQQLFGKKKLTLKIRNGRW